MAVKRAGALTLRRADRYVISVPRSLRVLLVFATLVLAATALIEAILRMTGGAWWSGSSTPPSSVTQPNRTRGYAFTPNASIDTGGVTTRLNRLGLRGPEPTPPIAVLALGDELTFGWGVADSLTYPEQLAATIRDTCPECGGVLNAGVPGYTSYQGLMLLRELGASQMPRVVVVEFHLNDSLRYRGEVPTMPSACRWSALCTATWRWAYATPPDWRTATTEVPLDRYHSNLMAIVSEARRVGAYPVLLSIGFRAGEPGAGDARRFRRGLLEDDYAAIVREVARATEAPLVEVLGSALRREVMLDELHPNAEAYAAIASLVAATLQDHVRPDIGTRR